MTPGRNGRPMLGGDLHFRGKGALLLSCCREVSSRGGTIERGEAREKKVQEKEKREEIYDQSKALKLSLIRGGNWPSGKRKERKKHLRGKMSSYSIDVQGNLSRGLPWGKTYFGCKKGQET